jgi:hypothetical protein
MDSKQELKRRTFQSNVMGIAKDSRRDESPTCITEMSPGKYPYKEDMDHLI